MVDSSSDSRPTAGSLERRRHPRFSPARQVALSCAEGVLSVFGWGRELDTPRLLDLSSSGLKLATSDCIPAGSVLRLKLSADGWFGEVEAFGEVRWSEPSALDAFDQSEIHAGVEFFGLAAEKIEHMSRLCEQLRNAS